MAKIFDVKLTIIQLIQGIILRKKHTKKLLFLFASFYLPKFRIRFRYNMINIIFIISPFFNICGIKKTNL
ncbi:hypothetical protein RC62_2549 [Flavobacterium aquidurense]|uniref:Uncharacterized protein n=1 Tax=Flavobacterium aquidurense TaxID=362413 RepID=A0A0Q0S298_9FLAO|nr:hypothetical protein RC62_2549 [Flavobacterium aquidurense]